MRTLFGERPRTLQSVRSPVISIHIYVRPPVARDVTSQPTRHSSHFFFCSVIILPMVKIKTEIRSRKERRKQERQAKKKRGREEEVEEEESPPPKKKISKTRVEEEHVDIASDDDDDKAISKNHREPEEVPKSGDPYAHLDPNLAAALRNEDAEIAELEQKLGLGNKKDKKKLHKEFAKLEGYGDDFGDFLDDLDTMAVRVTGSGDGDYGDDSDAYPSDFDEDDESEPDESEPDEDIVAMKGPPMQDEEDSVVDIMEEESDTESDGEQGADAVDKDLGDASEVDDEEGEEGEKSEEPDHNPRVTYKPSQGQDIYGKSLDDDQPEATAAKYVPPHLRNREDSEDRQEKLRMLKRLLNNALNRLSEDTLMSVAQTVAKIYHDYPTSDVNENLWKNVVDAAVDRPIVMVTMIPVYTGCLAGVHLQTGDNVQLGGYLVEHIVSRLWKVRKLEAEGGSEDDISKEASNLMLCICYLYNFGSVHSSLMFDMVRSFIESFSELDIELLLLILSHSGYFLRSDDPSALKDIVLSVQDRQLNKNCPTSSRVEYMLSAMTDLKNNKRRKQDMAYSERTTKIRKYLGKIKSDTVGSSDSSCLRIRLQDVLDVDTKGRWWKVGAFWVGHQFNKGAGEEEESGLIKAKSKGQGEEEEELLKLAAKYRMNTDSRRAIFCIIMGSADCDDAFEKLVRAGMLKNRGERDCVRVLMECCGNENNFNPFYSHLASRICEYQPQCKFTFQLAFWDVFKQWDTVAQRKAANLAKLLYNLVAVHHSLKLGILKTLDITELDDTALIFLITFFSTMFESMADPSQVFELFERGIPKLKPDGTGGDEEGLRQSLSAFFLQTLKSSPKNKKKSKFRLNMKAAIKACETNELDTMAPAK
jgi:nucleolar MIF4G domain-containing protein 1